MHTSEFDSIFSLEDSHWWYVGLHALVESTVRKLGRTDLHMLDAGCGTGGMMTQLSRFGTVEGFDIADEAVQCCHRRLLTSVRQQDLNTWIPKPSVYDVIVSLDVLYHAAVKDDAEILGKIYAALRPGGMVILNLAAFECLRRGHDEVVETKRRYTRHILRHQLEDAGFVADRVTYRLPALFVAILMMKGWRKIMGIPCTDSSDLAREPWCINLMGRLMVWLDNAWIRMRLPMPFGSSVFAVARKPASR